LHIIIHPRKGLDESKAPGKLDNKGTGAISDLADNCFTIWRHKAKERVKHLKTIGKVPTPKQEKLLDRGDTYWICDKQRNGEWEGKIPLWFDESCYQYHESEKFRPIQFVDYTNK
jgi:twinkle protein